MEGGRERGTTEGREMGNATEGGREQDFTREREGV